MSLQRRLLLYLLVCAPLVWGVALYLSVSRARHEVNEMFDSELIRLARQVHSTLGPAYPATAHPATAAALPPEPMKGDSDAGKSELQDLMVAVWDNTGRLIVSDREGARLKYRPDASGFIEQEVDGHAWRVYYLHSLDGQSLVAAGQAVYERDELVYGLTVTQVVPWLSVLPVLLVVMAWSVRRALSPMHQLTSELSRRDASDLQPVRDDRAPAELKPLLGAVNGLFARIEELLVRERRFTADAAHELRTPLAVLHAQWDVVRRSGSPAERALAEDKLGAGLERMGRLITQMLALSRLESDGTAAAKAEVDWHPIVEQAMSDCLALSQRRHIELACEWPPAGTHPMPLLGDAELLTVMLRNLLDNAVRYAPERTCVTLRIDREHLELENEGPPLSTGQLERLGERFYRPDGQEEAGSGLGVSIARRVAELHRLRLAFTTRADGQGVRVLLRFDEAQR